MRAFANERKAVKEFEAIAGNSIAKLKHWQKSGHFIIIKRQANLGLEGILREGRGRGTSPSLIKKILLSTFISTFYYLLSVFY